MKKNELKESMGMKVKIVLMALVAVIAITGPAMAGITPGCYNVTGTWSEYLTNGQGGQAGNLITAVDTDWILGAELVPPANPATAPWSWDTTYHNGILNLVATGAWNGGGAIATGFELQVLSTGYDQQVGTLAWAMTGSGVLDTGNPFTMTATFGTPAASGTPTITPAIGGVWMGGELSSAQICIGPIDTTKLIPAPGALLLGSLGVGFVSWLRRRRTL